MKKCIKNKPLIISFIVLFTLVWGLQLSVKAEEKEEIKISEGIEGKISEELSSEIKDTSKDEKVAVSIWIKDIDYNKVEEEAKEKIPLSETDIKENEALVSEYIKVTRAISLTYHTINNDDFYDEISETSKDLEVIHIDNYSPNLILKVSKEDILELSANKKVLGIDLFADERKIVETANSIPAITADYTQSIGLTGDGVKVGILEYTNDTHATTVRNIVEDIVPNADIIMKYAHNKSEDYTRIDELIAEGVNVINYSSGYATNAGVYSDFAQYIDYIIENYDITFVKSSGNTSISSNKVTDPGMAYNCITVGSIFENNTADWSDDLFSTFSCYEELGGASKPDFTAPGEGIYDTKNGTSYSAPHVVGVIAQLMEENPALKSYPGAVKSILAAGTWHKTADDYGDNLWSPYYSNKEGAGVVDAKGSYGIVNGNNFFEATLDNGDFDYSGTFYVYSLNAKVKVALSWLKQTNLADLDLRIYNPRGSLVGYSLSSTNNTELIEFNPRYYRGTYTFVIDGYGLNNSSEDICVSWQQK